METLSLSVYIVSCLQIYLDIVYFMFCSCLFMFTNGIVNVINNNNNIINLLILFNNIN